MGTRISRFKAAAAIFSQLATRIAAIADQLSGGLVLLFNVDEHTGTFGGAKPTSRARTPPTMWPVC